ncbi:hypothetical protein PPYR_04203 [Photinus pyralis]|uniref:Thioredoxin domain-containing protein n=1 Tax=Photinus pyralis TaxID=7054 RepID=A0A1Y1K7N1_PHOPY|nr:protein disulfide-isomerase A5 [Photinus pyralis]KAB0802017.1 hypothetical protein PPYR_04203 [Photinus pyralis]
MKYIFFLSLFVILAEVPYYFAKGADKNLVIDNVVDIKDFKKILRTKTNVLVCFSSSLKQSVPVVQVFKEAALAIKGLGTMILVDCSGEAKKMCKKLKVSPETYILKHYKMGEFNKDYDRKETVTSMVNFMRDPTGELPWEEDAGAANIVHITDGASLAKLIRKEQKPVMIMFYAPWCGFCKSLKPEYAAAAGELQGQAILAAIDVNRPENAIVRSQYNITGFPTLLYYSNGVMKYQYEGENNKEGIISFMQNPHAPPVKVVESEWSDVDSEVVHLTTSSFDPVIKEEASLLIMFYAPWCGHCKRMKPEYEKAAAVMKNEGISGMLAAVDATKEQAVASKFSIKGYPTVKYFSYGEFKFDVNLRESAKIVEFMTNPQEPLPPPPAEVSWSEEKSDVVHLTEATFKPFLKKKKHVLVMFYAPWCGHCKKAKPEFTKAAESFKDDPKVEFAAVDCTTQHGLCSVNDVKGYPTIKYFSYYSKSVKHYNGGRTSEDFIKFMIDPEFVPVKKEADNWIIGDSNIVVLNDDSFKKEISSPTPTLVMFYAPWCGHCKRMKPQFTKAADELKAEGVTARFAIFDCTENPKITEEMDISGYPTVKLYVNGKFVKDYTGNRSFEDLKSFMKTKLKDEL